MLTCARHTRSTKDQTHIMKNLFQSHSTSPVEFHRARPYANVSTSHKIHQESNTQIEKTLEILILLPHWSSIEPGHMLTCTLSARSTQNTEHTKLQNPNPLPQWSSIEPAHMLTCARRTRSTKIENTQIEKLQNPNLLPRWSFIDQSHMLTCAQNPPKQTNIIKEI